MKIPKTEWTSAAFKEGWIIPFSFLHEVKNNIHSWMDLDEETIEMVLLATEKVLVEEK